MNQVRSENEFTTDDIGRAVVMVKCVSGALHYVDAAEFANSIGVTDQEYAGWINSMHSLGILSTYKEEIH